jgi:hypothetical protein
MPTTIADNLALPAAEWLSTRSTAKTSRASQVVVRAIAHGPAVAPMHGAEFAVIVTSRGRRALSRLRDRFPYQEMGRQS